MTIHVHPLSDKTVEQRLAATSCHSSETQRATPLLSLNAMTIHACQSSSKSLFTAPQSLTLVYSILLHFRSNGGRLVHWYFTFATIEGLRN